VQFVAKDSKLDESNDMKLKYLVHIKEPINHQ
jgi:hypothetical protein